MNCSHVSQRSWHHAHGAAVEELDALDVGRADETAIERVGPAVILTAQEHFCSRCPSAIGPARWRQTLLKARSAPSLSRTTMIGSPTTSAVKKLSESEMVRFTPFTSPPRLAESSDEVARCAGKYATSRFPKSRDRCRQPRRRVLCALDLFVDVQVQRFRLHEFES